MEINLRPVLMTASDYLWSQSLASAVLSEDAVHLWYSSLDLPASILRRMEATLDEDDRERAKRFCSELERARFVAARGLLRRILGYYSGIEPSEFHFYYNPQGKPSLTERFGITRIQFNIAHSSGFAIFAVTLRRKIGVDLERVAPIVEAEKIVNRFFSDREKAAVHVLDGNAKLEAFFKIWTAKEAYLKARGEGLAHISDKIEVSFDPGESPCLLRTEEDMREDSRWSLEFLRPASGFMAAIVVERLN